MTVASDLSLAQIEQEISKREAERVRWQTALAADEAEWKGRAGRRAKIPEQLTDAQKRLGDVSAELQASATGNESPAEYAARRSLLFAQRRVAEQEILCCQKELAAYEAQDRIAARVARSRRAVKWRWPSKRSNSGGTLSTSAGSRRRSSRCGRRRGKRARPQPGGPPIGGKERLKLAAERKQLAQRIVETTHQQEQVNQQLTALKDQFKRLQEKVEATGKTYVTNTIGLMLRQQREALPNLSDCRRDIGAWRQAISEGQLELLGLKDRESALANLDLQTQAVMQKLSLAQRAGDRAELEAAVHEALKTERDYLKDLINDHDTYFAKLVDLVVAEHQLIDETESCALYIDQRVLWIASTTPISIDDVRAAGDGLWWLAGPEAWLGAGRTLAADAVRNPAISSLALCVFLAWLFWRPRFRARIREIGEKSLRGSCCRYVPTLEAALLTVVAAVGWPGLAWYFGWRLNSAAEASELCKALGAGLLATARVFLALELLRLTCSAGGLGEAHFGWPSAAVRLIRQNIRWFSLPALRANVCGGDDGLAGERSLGLLAGSSLFHRGAFVLLVGALSCSAPRSAVFQAMVTTRRGGWLERFRYVWYPLCALTPAALAVLAATGYHYTARQLVVRLILTSYVLVGGIVCRALLLRWTLVNQRKLAIEQARKRRAAAQGESNLGGEGPCGPDLPIAAAPERDLATINIQTRRLVEYSLGVACVLAVWCAWVDVLPALSSVNVGLWQTSVTVAEKVNLPGGRTEWKTSNGYRDIMLADLCLAVIVLATTVIAAKNIPGLLEMALLQHLPLDAGARYAVATVSRYLITIVGLLFCFGIVGINWSNGPMVGGRDGLGIGLRLAGDFRQFHLRPDHPFRAAGPRRRRGHDRGHDRRGVADSHPGHHHHRRRPQGTDHPQQGVYHRPGAELDAHRPHQSGRDSGERCLRLGYPTGGADAAETRPRSPQCARRPAAGGGAGILWRQCAQFRAAMLPAQFGQPGNGNQRTAHGHRSGLPRGGHRNALPAIRRTRANVRRFAGRFAGGVGGNQTAVDAHHGIKADGQRNGKGGLTNDE